jgi:hypothetical protein
MNPIVEMTDDPKDPVPLVELKQHLVIYVEDPPGPVSAKRVYDLYLQNCGDIFKVYRSTFDGRLLRDWDRAARATFEQEELPALRQTTDCGYGFSDDRPRDSWLFMFHGFRPTEVPEKASFYRFEFDWEVDPAFVRSFAHQMSQEVEFLSGYGGFFLQGRHAPYETESFDRIFALAMRYWGCEVVDVELTAAEMKKGYKCVNWLTLIGEPFRAKFPDQIRRARSVAYQSEESLHGVLLQASERPLLGDRNRMANMDGYARIAEALLPLQITEHAEFFGDLWTEQNTMAWLRRFTEAYRVV